MDDIFITKDNYHIEDILANGRCIVCGRLAHTSITDKTLWPKIRKHRLCGDRACKQQLTVVLEHLQGEYC